MNETMLSKWWKTPSAQAAMERARNKRNDELNQLKARTAARREQMVKDANEWEVVETPKPGLSKTQMDESFSAITQT